MVVNNENVFRDRTLILRILDERLQSRLREKMAGLEEEAAKKAAAATWRAHPHHHHPHAHHHHHHNHRRHQKDQAEGCILDLDGVSCEPALPASSSNNISMSQATLWNFHCDGAAYPARLTNLPCPIELHKIHDHAMFYKSSDVAQMLIVYEDMTALEEAETMAGYKVDGFPSYYHSGLTPPMSKVTTNRFSNREHPAIAPPFEEVEDVEKELIELIQSIKAKDVKKTARGSTTLQTQILETIEDEIVDYEPWMDDGGNEPNGIEFDETEAKCNNHPELWLDLTECKRIEEEKEDKQRKAVKERKKGASSSMSINSTVSTGTGTGGTTQKKTSKKKKSKGPPASSSSSLPATAPAETSRPPSTQLDLGDGLDNFDFDGGLADLDGFGGGDDGLDNFDMGLL